VKICIATKNPGKAREFREMLSRDGIDWTDLSQLRSVETPEETGETFAENAALKASYYARALNLWALADDSGLAVDALDGRPGVLSARWAEIHDAGAGDADNNALLVRQLSDKGPADAFPTARFVCALALANPAGEVVLRAQDCVEGEVIPEPRGSNGFGYDPHFFVRQFSKTMAELSPAEKHAISHRGKALRALKPHLDQLTDVCQSVRE
jgi:XTP/dITP diphosphohydrolase